MSAALPNNLHAELALDRGRLSRNGSERSVTRSFDRGHTTAMDPHARVQSVHGDIIVEPAQPYFPSENHGVIVEEPEPPSGMLSGADLAAVLDQEDDGGDDNDDDDDDEEIIRDRQTQPQSERPFPQRQTSSNNAAPQQNGGAYPTSILQNPSRSGTFPPPPRLSSSSLPASASPQQQAFPNRPRFTLTDSGPIESAPPSPGNQYGYNQGYSGDVHPHPHSAPSTPHLEVTPPLRRGGSPHSQPSTPKYATFEEMGIQGKNAEKEKDCIIM